MHDPPSPGERAECDGRVTGEHHPERHTRGRGLEADGDEERKDDPHGLLRVVRPVAEAIGSRGEELADAEPSIEPVDPAVPMEGPQHQDEQGEAE